jgi:hypothetical protein
MSVVTLKRASIKHMKCSLEPEPLNLLCANPALVKQPDDVSDQAFAHLHPLDRLEKKKILT